MARHGGLHAKDGCAECGSGERTGGERGSYTQRKRFSAEISEAWMEKFNPKMERTRAEGVLRLTLDAPLIESLDPKFSHLKA